MSETLSALQREILRRVRLGLSLDTLASPEDRRVLREKGLILVQDGELALTSEGQEMLRHEKPPPACRKGIRCSVDRVRSILMIEIDADLSTDLMRDVERMVRIYKARHGLADVVLDLTHASGTLDVDFVRARGNVQGTMAGRKRIFVVSEAHHYGLTRVYRAQKETIGEITPAIARTIDRALEALGSDRAAFRPLPLD